MSFSVCLYYIKSSKQPQVTNTWLLLPHSQSFLSCSCTPASVSTLPCGRMLQTLSIMGLPPGYTSHSGKPCSWAHSPAAALSLDFSHYPIHCWHPWAHKSAQHCSVHLRWQDLSSLCARLWHWEWVLLGTKCSIRFCFLPCEFFTLGWIKLKTRKSA